MYFSACTISFRIEEILWVSKMDFRSSKFRSRTSNSGFKVLMKSFSWLKSSGFTLTSTFGTAEGILQTSLFFLPKKFVIPLTKFLPVFLIQFPAVENAEVTPLQAPFKIFPGAFNTFLRPESLSCKKSKLMFLPYSSLPNNRPGWKISEKYWPNNLF